MTGIKNLFNQKHLFDRSGKSVFAKTLCTLLILFSGIILLFMGLLTREYQKHHRERFLQANSSLLIQTGNMMEASLDILQNQLNQVLWSSDVIEYLVNPEQMKQREVYDIQAMLVELVNSNPMYREIWLYSQVNDQVIDSSGEYSDGNSFSGSQLMTMHTWGEGMSTPNSREGMTQILVDQGQIYLVQDIILSKPLGSIYARLDMESLDRQLNLQNMEETLWVMDVNGQRVDLSGNQSSITLEKAPDTDILMSEDYVDIGDIENYSGQRWLGTSKENLNMYFLLRLQPENLITDVSEMLPDLLPQLLLFLLLGILGCFFITDSIYRPINRLVEMVLDVSGEKGEGEVQEKGSNEMDYLRLSFFQTLDEKKKLEYSMRRFYDDIVEQGLRKLLQGESIESSGLKELDAEWCKEWCRSERYQVILCQKSTELNSLSSITDGQLFYRIIDGLVSKKSTQLHLRVISMELNLTAILLCSAEGQTLEHFREEGLALEQELSNSFRNTAYKVHIAHGKQYSALEDIYYSMQEARQMLQYEEYVQRSGPVGKEEKVMAALDSENLEPVLMNEVYYRERSRHVLDHVLKNQKKEGLELAHRILDKMVEDALQEGDQQRLFEIFMTGIIEKYRNMCGKDISVVNCDPGQREKVMDDILEDIWSVSTKNTYRYVEVAKQYIQEHYSDVNLSIQEVADYVNIHSTYLSKIFSDYTGESYSNYINNLRVDHAKEMLSQTEGAVREIGFRCGFNTVQSFNRVFKKYTGTTPTEFRKNKG